MYQFEAELRRWSLRRSETRTFEEFYKNIETLYLLKDLQFLISYIDPRDNDLLPINNNDNFGRAISTAKPLLRLIIQRKGMYNVVYFYLIFCNEEFVHATYMEFLWYDLSLSSFVCASGFIVKVLTVTNQPLYTFNIICVSVVVRGGGHDVYLYIACVVLFISDSTVGAERMVFCGCFYDCKKKMVHHNVYCKERRYRSLN